MLVDGGGLDSAVTETAVCEGRCAFGRRTAVLSGGGGIRTLVGPRGPKRFSRPPHPSGRDWNTDGTRRWSAVDFCGLRRTSLPHGVPAFAANHGTRELNALNS